MHDYRLGDVQRILGLSAGVVRALVRQRFVNPSRGARREYRFSFQDLIALRAARTLAQAGLPARRIARSLQQLRRRLPEQLPVGGLSIRAVGDQVLVRERQREWDSASGQYVLALEVQVERSGAMRVIEARPALGPSSGTAPVSRAARPAAEPRVASEAEVSAAAEELFLAALALEDTDPAAAERLYQRCLQLQAAHRAARVNLGRLLQQRGDVAEAERVYRHPSCETDALALFNLAVLLEDAGRAADAIATYTAALSSDPQLADAHYNLARLHEQHGNGAHTIRHLRMYRLLAGKPAR